MTLEIGSAWVAQVLLCALRLSPVLLLTPILNGYTLPVRVKAMLLLALSACLVAGLPALPDPPATLPAMLLAAAAELATGGLLAFGVLTAFSAIAFAGKILDIQMGYSLGNVFDPVTGTQSPLLASALGLFAVVMFFTLDAHHALLRGAAWSLHRLPLGQLAQATPELLLRQFGTVFSLGLALAAPLVFCLFMIELGLAVMSRNLPQMNVFVISVPAKIMVGLAMLAFLARHMEPTYTRIFGAIFTFWERIL